MMSVWIVAFILAFLGARLLTRRKQQVDHTDLQPESSAYPALSPLPPAGLAPPRHRHPADAVARVVSAEKFGYEIEYADVFGEITCRAVTVVGVAEEPRSGLLYLLTHCHLRGEPRTFRVDRIRMARGPDGAVAGDLTAHYRALAELLPGGLRRWGDDDRAVSVPPEHEHVMERARPGLSALVWLAAADGDVSEAEIGVMFDWIEIRANVARGRRESWDRDAARGWIREARPTLAGIRGGLGRMGRAEASAFRSTLEALVVADGVSDRLERGRLARIVAHLPPP